MSWFTRGARNFRHLTRELFNRPVAYLEIGVWCGESLAWVAENVLTHDESSGVGVDPYAAMGKHDKHEMGDIYRQATALLAQYQKVMLFREYSSVWLRRQRMPHQYDLIYIDGDHTAPCVLDDAVLCWPLLKVGGLLAFDDYANRGSTRNRENHVRHAAEAFVASHQSYVEVLVRNSQLWLRKTGEVKTETLRDGIVLSADT